MFKYSTVHGTIGWRLCRCGSISALAEPQRGVMTGIRHLNPPAPFFRAVKPDVKRPSVMPVKARPRSDAVRRVACATCGTPGGGESLENQFCHFCLDYIYIHKISESNHSTTACKSPCLEEISRTCFHCWAEACGLANCFYFAIGTLTGWKAKGQRI